MKLHEVITISDKDIVQGAKNRQRTNIDDFETLKQQLSRLGIQGKLLGDGLFSVVVSDDHDPGTVKKITHGEYGEGYTVESILEDAYFKYLLAISKNERMSWNPYLPKVYNIKFFESKDGRIAFTLEMERLQPFKTLNEEEMMYLGNKMFRNFEEALKQELALYDPPKDPRVQVERIGIFLIGEIEALVKRGRGKYTRAKDSHLRHATQLANQIIRKHTDIFGDIHNGNIMVRRTPYGPQLVITDPIAN